MTANELRINNLVLIDGKVRKLTSISEIEVMYFNERDKSTYLCTFKNVQPIPLTNEILEGIGFEKVNHIHGYSFWMYRKDGVICVGIYENHTEVNFKRSAHIKYVHQLQNLYFSLTNTELPITLK